MNVELNILADGGVMLVCDEPLPSIVRRVEYFKEQRLFLLIYNEPDHEGELTHYEVPEKMSGRIEKSPSVIIYSLFPDREPIGYKVSLIKVGI